jgi:hypothetical protein
MPSPIEIDTESALRALDECVAERGADYTYKPAYGACFYWDSKTNSPDCLIGMALHKLGVSADILIYGDTLTFYLFAGRLRHSGIAVITNDAIAVLRRAQAEQDCGKPWGYAVEQARSVYSNTNSQEV